MWPLSSVHSEPPWSRQTYSGQRSCDNASTESRRPVPGAAREGESPGARQIRVSKLGVPSQNNVSVPRAEVQRHHQMRQETCNPVNISIL